MQTGIKRHNCSEILPIPWIYCTIAQKWLQLNFPTGIPAYSQENRNRAGNYALLTSENGKLAALTSGRPAFREHAERTEGSDTTPALHVQKVLRTEKKQQHHQIAKRSRSPVGPRRLGTATRISASLSRRLFAFFGSTLDQAPKAAKYAVLIPGPGVFVNVRNGPRVVIPPPSEMPPVSPCVPLCAIL